MSKDPVSVAREQLFWCGVFIILVWYYILTQALITTAIYRNSYNSSYNSLATFISIYNSRFSSLATFIYIYIYDFVRKKNHFALDVRRQFFWHLFSCNWILSEKKNILKQKNLQPMNTLFALIVESYVSRGGKIFDRVSASSSFPLNKHKDICRWLKQGIGHNELGFLGYTLQGLIMQNWHIFA